MAKKDDKTQGEEYEFEVPDFDEDAFIHKELVSFRTTSVLFVVGIISALVSWGIFEAMDGAKATWYIGLAIMAVFAYLLRFIYPALKIDITHFGRREWFGTFFLLFFAWLAFFLLLVNPPISDHADPTTDVFASPSVQMAGHDVTIDLFVADNFRVDDFTFDLQQGGLAIASAADLVQDPNFEDRHSVTLEDLAPGTYTYTATVTDGKGRTNSTEGHFLVGTQVIQVDLPDDGTLDLGDYVFVTVQDMMPCILDEDADINQFADGGDCIRTVGLELQNGNTVPMEFNVDFQAWAAVHTQPGWTAGTNDFTVVVQQQDRFHGIERIEGGEVRSTGHTVEVPAPQATKIVEVPRAPDESPVTKRTPGVGMVAGIAVLVGAAVVARRRQE